MSLLPGQYAFLHYMATLAKIPVSTTEIIARQGSSVPVLRHSPLSTAGGAADFLLPSSRVDPRPWCLRVFSNGWN